MSNDRLINGREVPDSLTTLAGEKISSTEEWQTKRRPEILELFQKHVYGRPAVDLPEDMWFELINEKKMMDGKADFKEVGIHFKGPGGKGMIRLYLFIPIQPRPAPVFLLICNRDKENIDPTREIQSPFWPAEEIVERGYAAAAFHNSDADPDFDDNFKNGVHGIFDPPNRKPDAWGTISAWAWAASRVMDYFESDPAIDNKRVAVVGHSRGGKTALLCGAQDERFALTVSNGSGCTGAAISRGKDGETIKIINQKFPHWFCENYKSYADRESELPIDQHMLITLMAPRPVYVASASEDRWADPPSEFLSCIYADQVYHLFNLPGIETQVMPEPESPIRSGLIGYHLRIGEHNLTKYDWNCFMDFADKHMK